MEKTLQFDTLLNSSLEAVTDFHADPHALKRLTPPPIIVQMIRDDRQSLTSGELAFRFWIGPLPVNWVARHEAGPTSHSFVDRMLAGPLARWEHEHIFAPEGDRVRLIDRITLAHKSGWRGFFTRLMFDGLPLRLVFWFRHWRTRRVLGA